MSGVSTQIIRFATNQLPVGIKNGANLVFEAPTEFDPATLQVFLSGLSLIIGNDFIIASDHKTITIVLEPNDPTRLNVAPLQNEPFRLSYVTV